MIGFIGGGKMAEALIEGIASQKNNNIFVAEPLMDRRQYLETTYKIKVYQSNQEVAGKSNIIILAIKPQDMGLVLDEITSVITDAKIVISIAAGITLASLREKLRTKKIFRVMPNTPVIVREGMSIVSFDKDVSDEDVDAVQKIFMSVGKVLVLPEEQQNTAATISGCGPAFIALFAEALTSAALEFGLDVKDVIPMVLQTFVGTAKLLESGMSPEALRDMVTSPNGMTAAGLKAFEEKELKNIVAQVLLAALRRGDELGSKYV